VRQVVRWPVAGGQPVGLSVNSWFNVLVACSDSLSVYIFTPLGCPVSQLSIPPPPPGPPLLGVAHAVQLDCNSVVLVGVTQSAHSLACVYRLDADQPDVIDTPGCPRHVALASSRAGTSYVWLSERGTGVRLIQLPASQCCADMPRVQDVAEPDKICCDDSTQRLYVVDHGHVKVFRVRMPPDDVY